ncbi:MAG TPA: hypothetical protein VMZ50_06810 [Phycisphaerae bacterium]|nr:hypothetical protein [Phycisphaerae bacterium]
MIVIHVTHEAVEKIGGIGAVIAGLTTAGSYSDKVSRTILLGPLLTTDRPVNLRLGDGGKILYSSLDAILFPPWKEKFLPIERTYDVGIVYGTRKISEPCGGREVEVEVLLVDVFHANKARLDLFKGELYKKFAIPSDRFEDIWEYEQYVRLAEPGFEALKVIGATDPPEQTIVLAHEHMGIPTALRAILDGSPNVRTVFYAHEVASVRPIVEKLPGHDTVFYNILTVESRNGRSLEDVFPRVFQSYKHPLVKAGRYCDGVFAVGDHIVSELRFLDRHFRTMRSDLVYNGIPALPLTVEERRISRDRMRSYAENLFAARPTWTFTHVARPVLSKGIWRDLAVLHAMEPLLRDRGQTAVYFMLGTLAGQRRGPDVRQMERVYGWPVHHELGYPDQCGGEEVLGEMFEVFNRDHEAVRAVFVNQWDWNRAVCGERMPEEMTFSDIRRGTDVEFGLSVYEPFGISQLEPLCFGAVCVVSNVCGCMGFVRRVAGGNAYDENVIEADFLRVPETMGTDDLLAMSIAQRNSIEAEEARRLAERVIEALPRGEEEGQQRIVTGYQLADKMSWERVVQDYFLPGLTEIVSRT